MASPLTAADQASGAGGIGRRTLEISISIRTILLVAGTVAIPWALSSIANVLLVIFGSAISDAGPGMAKEYRRGLATRAIN
jgi:hypothetical protein